MSELEKAALALAGLYEMPAPTRKDITTAERRLREEARSYWAARRFDDVAQAAE